jgi:hypothetical protein
MAKEFLLKPANYAMPTMSKCFLWFCTPIKHNITSMTKKTGQIKEFLENFKIKP